MMGLNPVFSQPINPLIDFSSDETSSDDNSIDHPAMRRVKSDSSLLQRKKAKKASRQLLDEK